MRLLTTFALAILFLATTSYSRAADEAAADANSSSEHTGVASGTMPVSFREDSPAAADSSAPPDAPATDNEHRFGIGAEVSTLGIGGQAAVSLNRKLNLRGG